MLKRPWVPGRPWSVDHADRARPARRFLLWSWSPTPGQFPSRPTMARSSPDSRPDHDGASHPDPDPVELSSRRRPRLPRPDRRARVPRPRSASAIPRRDPREPDAAKGTFTWTSLPADPKSAPGPCGSVDRRSSKHRSLSRGDLVTRLRVGSSIHSVCKRFW